MAKQDYKKIFGVKRTIWSSASFYVQDSNVQEQYRRDVADSQDCNPDEFTEADLASLWYEDNQCNFEAELGNLNKDIDGVIIAIGYRYSHYGAICGNGREGTKIVGHNIADILYTAADSAEWYAEDYNIHGRTGDHDGSWSIVYRVCKNFEEAEKLQGLAYMGKLDNADIMGRTTSLYPYIAKIYGWPYRGSKKRSEH